jgi:hypothetical protein
MKIPHRTKNNGANLKPQHSTDSLRFGRFKETRLNAVSLKFASLYQNNVK